MFTFATTNVQQQKKNKKEQKYITKMALAHTAVPCKNFS